jgi:hypothetical protein
MVVVIYRTTGLALGYGLYDRGVRVPAGTGNFSHFHLIQTGSGTFPRGVKWSGCEADLSPPSSAEVRIRGAITSLPNTPTWRGAQFKNAQGQLYLYSPTYKKSYFSSDSFFWGGYLMSSILLT